MATTYSTSLKLALIGDGEQAGIWGQTTNTNLGTLLEQAITGVQTITMVDADYTLTNFNGVPDEARNPVLVVTGTNTAVRDVIAPLVNKQYLIYNNTTGGFAIRIRGASGLTVTIPNGAKIPVYCDGTNFYTAELTATTGNIIINGNATVTGNVATNQNITVGKTLSGTYSQSGSYNGQATYYNSNSWVSFFPTNGNGWYMNDALTESYALYYDDNINGNPWENTWLVSSGVSPAGTTVTGACAGGGGGGGETSTTTTSTSTEAYLGSLVFGTAIQITMLSLLTVGFIWNSIRNKK